MSQRTRRVVAAVVALVLVLGFALAAISALGSEGDGAAAPVEPELNEEARQAPEAGLAPFYEQRLTWRNCGNRLACAQMEVPLDYDRPNARTIEISLLKRYAADERRGSLVVNPGGPGAPGTDYARNASMFFRDPISDSFDVVGFDPRGTGASAPVDCVSDAELDAFIAADPTPDTPAEERAARSAIRRLLTGCAARDRELAQHVSTIEAARDMDVLRALLEEERLTYFGASYGTQLGATYAELFPDRVGQMVLDGGVDPTLSGRQSSLGQAGGFDTALRAFVANCVEVSDSCFLGDNVEEGLDRIQDFQDQLEEAPLPVGDRELTEGLAFFGLAAPLYDRSTWLYLSTGLKNAFKGDGALLLLLADAYSSRTPEGTYANNIVEANAAINCLDSPGTSDLDEVRAAVPDFEEASPVFGRVFAWGLLGCPGQQVRSTEKPRTIEAAGAPPILVVGTTRDPATPLSWSRGLADQLDSGVLVVRDGDGHTGYNAGNACVDRAVEDYLLRDEVPRDGLTCRPGSN